MVEAVVATTDSAKVKTCQGAWRMVLRLLLPRSGFPLGAALSNVVGACVSKLFLIVSHYFY